MKGVLDDLCSLFPKRLKQTQKQRNLILFSIYGLKSRQRKLPYYVFTIENRFTLYFNGNPFMLLCLVCLHMNIVKLKEKEREEKEYLTNG